MGEKEPITGLGERQVGEELFFVDALASTWFVLQLTWSRTGSMKTHDGVVKARAGDHWHSFA